MRRHGSKSLSELEIRRGREGEDHHARDSVNRLHDPWRAEDRLREEMDLRSAERLARKE